MRRGNTATFKEKASLVHNDKYDYSLVEYINTTTRVIIICPEHGEFYQKPQHHLVGSGCSNCGLRSGSSKRRLNSTTFKEKAIVVHNDKYDYSLVEYINTATRVIIICPEHGEFTQTPKQHLQGHQCIKCASQENGISRRTTLDEWKRAAGVVHNFKYEYTNSVYDKTHSKVEIECPIHGQFFQKANDHLQGYGCSKCGNIGIYNFKYFEKFPYNRLILGSIYVMMLINETETFLKVGITKNKVNVRRTHISGYQTEIIFETQLMLFDSFLLEQKILEIFHNEKVKPNIKFGGHTECFNVLCKTAIINLINEETKGTTYD